jgi:hypothetical protein
VRESHCRTCHCQSTALFTTTFDPHAGRLKSAQTSIAFSNVTKAERQGAGLVVYLAGDEPVWLYGDDRERFLSEWSEHERDERELPRSTRSSGSGTLASHG